MSAAGLVQAHTTTPLFPERERVCNLSLNIFLSSLFSFKAMADHRPANLCQEQLQWIADI